MESSSNSVVAISGKVEPMFTSCMVACYPAQLSVIICVEQRTSNGWSCCCSLIDNLATVLPCAIFHMFVVFIGDLVRNS